MATACKPEIQYVDKKQWMHVPYQICPYQSALLWFMWVNLPERDSEDIVILSASLFIQWKLQMNENTIERI